MDSDVVIGNEMMIEEMLNEYAERFRKRARIGDGKLAAGFITASLIYCTGSMAILGAVQDGVGSAPNILYAKAALDAIISVALASAMLMLALSALAATPVMAAAVMTGPAVAILTV